MQENNQRREEGKCPVEKVFPTDKPAPEKITVMGAGTVEVNGVYVKDIDEDGELCYHMQDDTRYRIVKVYLHDFDNCPFAWAIQDQDVHDPFYFRLCVESDRQTKLPPQETGWMSVDDCEMWDSLVLGGEEPVPIILHGDYIPFDWRVNPQQSRSDWTIQITSQNHDGKMSTDEYHIHCSALTMGSRGSEYFKQVCREDRFVESKERLIRINLDPLTASEFPVLLDYLYGRELRIHYCNAVVLLELASYFDCPEMLHEANVFCSTRLDPNNCGYFYEQANTLGREDVIREIEKLCVAEISDRQVFDYQHIVSCTPPTFWLSVMNKLPMTADDSEWLSLILAKNLEYNKCDKQTFEQMMAKLTMVSELAACNLIKHELRFLFEYEEHGAGRKRCRQDEKTLTRLQTHCLEALVRGLRERDPRIKINIEIPEGCPAIICNTLLKVATGSM
jgi:hypothetical protein